jgi:hypothetical protein
MKRPAHPDADRVGVLIAALLLTFALSRLVQSPQLILRLRLPGFYLEYPLGVGTLLSVLAAGLTAAGMDWLLREQEQRPSASTVEHWLVPALTTLVMGAPLALLPDGPAWWIGFGFGGLLLTGAVLSEFVVMDRSARAYGIARARLTALSYALFLILVIALRFSDLRMVLLIPPIFVTATLISLRILHLDGPDRWDFPWAVGIGLICAQLGAGLRYWPLTPLQFGMALIGPLFALTYLANRLAENVPVQRAAIGPGIILVLSWASVVVLR